MAAFGLISCTENQITGQLLDVTATASLSFLSLLTESNVLDGGPLPALWPWPPATGSGAPESGVGLCEGHVCCRPTSALGPGPTHLTGLDLQVKATLCSVWYCIYFGSIGFCRDLFLTIHKVLNSSADNKGKRGENKIGTNTFCISTL